MAKELKYGSYSQKQQSDGEGGITLAYTSKKFDADFTYNPLLSSSGLKSLIIFPNSISPVKPFHEPLIK